MNNKFENQYQPSPEEVKKAEEMMANTQEGMSRQEVQSMFRESLFTWLDDIESKSGKKIKNETRDLILSMKLGHLLPPNDVYEQHGARITLEGDVTENQLFEAIDELADAGAVINYFLPRRNPEPVTDKVLAKLKERFPEILVSVDYNSLDAKHGSAVDWKLMEIEEAKEKFGLKPGMISG